MNGGVLAGANRIQDICKALKALPLDDGAFADYRKKLLAELQWAALNIEDTQETESVDDE